MTIYNYYSGASPRSKAITQALMESPLGCFVENVTEWKSSRGRTIRKTGIALANYSTQPICWFHRWDEHTIDRIIQAIKYKV